METLCLLVRLALNLVTKLIRYQTPSNAPKKVETLRLSVHVIVGLITKLVHHHLHQHIWYLCERE